MTWLDVYRFAKDDRHAAAAPVTVAVRSINPADTTGLQLSAPAPADLPDVTIPPGTVVDVTLS